MGPLGSHLGLFGNRLGIIFDHLGVIWDHLEVILVDSDSQSKFLNKSVSEIGRSTRAPPLLSRVGAKNFIYSTKK